MKNELLKLLSESLNVDREDVTLPKVPEDTPLETIEKWAEEKTEEERKAFVEGVLCQLLVSQQVDIEDSPKKTNNMYG